MKARESKEELLTETAEDGHQWPGEEAADVKMIRSCLSYQEVSKVNILTLMLEQPCDIVINERDKGTLTPCSP